MCFSRFICTNPSHFPHSMSVTQAMEWLIEHVDDPTVDLPLPGQEAQGAAGSAAAASASASAAAASAGPSPLGPGLQVATSSQSSSEEAKQDELTEIFKRIRRKREFRPDSRVSAVFHKRLVLSSVKVWLLSVFTSLLCFVHKQKFTLYFFFVAVVGNL